MDFLVLTLALMFDKESAICTVSERIGGLHTVSRKKKKKKYIIMTL